MSIRTARRINKGVGVHDVIIQSNFGFNTFRGFISTGGQNFRFPIDFAGHRYNSADATAQPVIGHMNNTGSIDMARRTSINGYSQNVELCTWCSCELSLVKISPSPKRYITGCTHMHHTVIHRIKNQPDVDRDWNGSWANFSNGGRATFCRRLLCVFLDITSLENFTFDCNVCIGVFI